MRLLPYLPLLFLLSAPAHAGETPPPAADTAALEAEARGLVSGLSAELLATVRQAMQAGGPVQAIGACQLLAPEITARHGKAPWRIGRTSLRLRNPGNAPDAWERQVLEQFARDFAAGRPLGELRQGAVVDGEFRYMQAIGVGEPCLACHGGGLGEPVRQALRERYPADAAQGFAVGDLRGAFTVRRKLEAAP